MKVTSPHGARQLTHRTPQSDTPRLGLVGHARKRQEHHTQRVKNLHRRLFRHLAQAKQSRQVLSCFAFPEAYVDSQIGEPMTQ